MTFNLKNNHTNEIYVFKLVKNEVLHKILGLICQKIKIQDGRGQTFLIYTNKHIKEKKWNIAPTSDLVLHMLDDMCAKFHNSFQIKLSNVLLGILQGQREGRQ